MRKISVVVVLLFSILFLNLKAEAASSSQLIIINKKTNTLAFYNVGKLVRTFRVATGKTRALTPEGTFHIVNKIKNRPYYTLGIPGGDPRNPLGNRWMGLDADGTYGTTYAIHGNSNESSIGKYISHGCIRMHNVEVQWLFDQVQLYTPVIITYSSSSFQAIAKANGYNVGTANGWVQTSGKTYYYVNGAAQIGWQKINSKWYYFDSTGVMRTGWLSYNYHWYYLDSSGAMKTGWIKYNSKWYYFHSSGARVTGWLTDFGHKYFLDPNGAMLTGWVTIYSKSYYFNRDGTMDANTTVDGYHLGPDGARM